MTFLSLGIEFKPIFVDILKGAQTTPQFLEMNPSGKVPVIKDGNLTMSERFGFLFFGFRTG